jgi:hypothetical protein
MGALLLAVHQNKLGNEQMAAGFFSFVASQTLVISGSAMVLAAGSPSFGAAAGLWVATAAYRFAESSSNRPLPQLTKVSPK